MADYTIRMLIDDNGDELELSIINEVVTAGLPPDQNDQRTRRRVPGRKNSIKGEKKKRHNASHRHPDVVGPHLPFYLINHSGPHNDIIVFECGTDFVVDVSLDDGFDPPQPGSPAAPLNPFGWLFPQTGTAAAPVRGTIDKAAFPGGLSRMDFYKITVWCNGKKLDPDLICESGP